MKFGIKNLRRLRNVPPIELKPITLLVGRNSSGKSSFLRLFTKVFDQLASNGEHLAQLRSLTRSRAWRDIFFEFIDFLVWIFAGGRRIAT